MAPDTLTGRTIGSYHSGPDNGLLDYPLRLFGLVLDAEGSPATSGAIYLDDLMVQ